MPIPSSSSIACRVLHKKGGRCQNSKNAMWRSLFATGSDPLSSFAEAARKKGLGEMYASAHNWTQTRARRKQARVENQHHFALLWSILCLVWGFVGGYNAYLLTLLESIRREVIVLSGLIEAEYKCKLKAWWKQGARKWKQARADESNWALACAQEWKQACA